MLNRLGYIARSVLYWLRTHTINRYHLLDMRDKENGYAWGWMDRDQLMLFACFKLLVDYVEKEKPFDHFDYDWSEESRKRGDEIKALYDWWKTERAAEHKAVEKLESRFERVERRWALEEKDDQMLRRLIEVRRHLWT